MDEELVEEDEVFQLFISPTYSIGKDYTDHHNKWRKKDSLVDFFHKVPLLCMTVDTNVFCKKSCVKYVKVSDNGCCHCGRDKHKSFINGEWRYETEQVDWSKETCIDTSPTNAFGEITFYGADKNTKAKYLRLSDTSCVQEVVNYMRTKWEFGNASQLLISVIGSADGYIQNEKFEQLFKRGLRKVALSTHAWVFTGGTNVGIHKVVGDALRDVCQFDSTSSDVQRYGSVRCIGIVPWGAVPIRKRLICDGTNDKKVNVNVKMKKKYFLEQSHSHFLLVDDGTIGKYSTEKSFRHKLENAIKSSFTETVKSTSQDLEEDNNQNNESSKKLATVKLVVGGGPHVIEDVRETIENKIPVILFKETSQAAALFAFACELTPLKDCNLVEIEEHQKLIELIGQEYPDLTMEDKTKYYDIIMECMKHSKYISIFSLQNKTGKSIDKMILNAFFKTVSDSHSFHSHNKKIFDQLMLAIKWNRADFVETLLEKLSLSGADGNLKLNNLLLEAIMSNKPQVVQVLLEDVLELNYGCLKLTDSDFVRMYRKRSTKINLNILHLLLKDAKNSDQCKGLILKALTMFADIHEKEFTSDIYKNLFLFAVMSNMREMAMLFLQHGERALAKVLLACKIYDRMRTFYRKHTESQKKDLVDSLMRKERHFKELAYKLLNTYSLKQELLTGRILRQRADDYGSKNLICLAASAEHVEFISHDTCQAMLTDVIWHGNLKFTGNTRVLHTIKVAACLIPPFFMLSSYKTKAIARMEGRTKREILENKLFDGVRHDITKKESPGIKNKVKGWVTHKFYQCKNFYEAPITKFTGNLISYCFFLILFSWLVTHKLERNFKRLEYYLLTFWFAFLLEEIRQIIQSPVGRTLGQKLNHYLSSKWNILDMFALLFFIIALILRVKENMVMEARVFYAIDIFLWILRLLHMFSISKHLGPYVEMIHRMTLDLVYFAFVLTIFLLAYGVARFAILFPNNDSVGSVFTTVLSVPYNQMHANSMEDVKHGIPSNLTVFSMNYVKVAEPAAKVCMAAYMLLATVMLINLLIARFSSIYDSVQATSEKTWKFNRYFLIEEYEHKSLLPLPLSAITNLVILTKHFYKKCFCCHTERQEEKEFFPDERHELEGFEREGLMRYLVEYTESQEQQDQNEKYNCGTSSFVWKMKLLMFLRLLQCFYLSMDSNDEGGPCKIPIKLTGKDAIRYNSKVLYYPLTSVKRTDVSPDQKPWAADCENYNPKPLPEFFPVDDKNISDKNPNGRTGFIGNGLLPKYGPNLIVESILTRFKPGLMGIETDSNDLGMLQVLVVYNPHLSKYTIPSGPPSTRLCGKDMIPKLLPLIFHNFFDSDSLDDPSLWLSKSRIEWYNSNIDQMILNGEEIFCGNVDDPRNTDNAWVETTVLAFHDEIGEYVSKYLESGLTQQFNLTWTDVDKSLALPWRHMRYLNSIAKKYKAHI